MNFSNKDPYLLLRIVRSWLVPGNLPRRPKVELTERDGHDNLEGVWGKTLGIKYEEKYF